jgi:hypothetical protein
MGKAARNARRLAGPKVRQPLPVASDIVWIDGKPIKTRVVAVGAAGMMMETHCVCAECLVEFPELTDW